MEILQDKDNFLFNRKEIKLIVEAEKSPSFEEASDILSENFKSDKDTIVIKGVRGKFGRNTFLISGFIYKTKDDKDKFEPKKKEKKKEGEAPAPTPAAPAPEKPVEEKKEEKTEEKKE